MLRTVIVTVLAVVAVADFARHSASARDLASDTGRIAVMAAA